MVTKFGTDSKRGTKINIILLFWFKALSGISVIIFGSVVVFQLSQHKERNEGQADKQYNRQKDGRLSY